MVNSILVLIPRVESSLDSYHEFFSVHFFLINTFTTLKAGEIN